MKTLIKWFIGTVLVILSLGFLPYILPYLAHRSASVTTTPPCKSPNGRYEAYVEYKKAGWLEATLCIKDATGRVIRSYPITGDKFGFEPKPQFQWSPDSTIVAARYYGPYTTYLYGIQAMDVSGRSCESFGEFQIPVDGHREKAVIADWMWASPDTIRFTVVRWRNDTDDEVTQQVTLRVIHNSEDFRIVRPTH